MGPTKQNLPAQYNYIYKIELTAVASESLVTLFPEAQRKILKTPLENLMRTVQEARQKFQCKALSAGETETGAHGVLNT